MKTSLLLARLYEEDKRQLNLFVERYPDHKRTVEHLALRIACYTDALDRLLTESPEARAEARTLLGKTVKVDYALGCACEPCKVRRAEFYAAKEGEPS